MDPGRYKVTGSKVGVPAEAVVKQLDGLIQIACPTVRVGQWRKGAPLRIPFLIPVEGTEFADFVLEGLGHQRISTSEG